MMRELINAEVSVPSSTCLEWYENDAMLVHGVGEINAEGLAERSVAGNDKS